MQFIPLPNFYKIIKQATTKTALTYVDISNTTRTLKSPWVYTSNTIPTFESFLPFFADKVSNYTGATDARLFVRASSDTTIQNYVPATQIGSCSCSVIENSDSNGWTMTINITANENDKINSLYFTRKLWYGGNGGENAESVIFAIKLDNEVTIDSSGTANFTFSIEF